MNRRGKPVRKCHACPLNLGTRCAIYQSPHDMWHGRRCQGYMNDELLNQYLEEKARHQTDAHKERRRQAAKLNRTVAHFQGVRGRGY